MDSQNYESLKDPHLNEYYNNKRIRRHLIKAGLINRHGEILPSATHEDVITRRTKRRQERAKLSYRIANYVIEEERKRQTFFRDQFDLALKRSRVQKIRESKYPPRRSMSHNVIYLAKHSKPRNTRTPSPKLEKRSPVRPKSARYPVINVKNQAIRRPATAKQSSNDDACQVTMVYYGPQKNVECQPKSTDEIIVMQQHCGGENLVVFKGFVRPNETFTFDSRRHRDYPFALAIYINGLIDSRISVCCEYKHKHNVRLGSKYGLFGIFDVQKSQPCRVCRFEQRKKKILSTITKEKSPSPNRKSILTSKVLPGALLRTPVTSPEREKTPSKRAINRVSTVVQASMSPRTLSSASSHHKDEPKKEEKPSTPDQKKNDSKKPSSTSKISRQSSSDISFKNEEPHHSSEPILSRKDHDEDNSSRKSDPSPISFFDDDEDSLRLQKDNTNNYPIRPLSSSSSSTSTGLIKTNDNDVLSKSSSRSSASIALNKNNDNRDPSRSSSRSSASIPLNKNNDNPIPSSLSSSSRSIGLIKNYDNPVRSRSSSSATLKRSSSSSSSISSLEEEEEDYPPPLKILPGEDEQEKPLSRTSSRISKTSNSSYLKNKPDEKISSSSSSTPDTVNHLLVSDKQSDSSETIEHEPHRPSISSFDSELTDDKILQNPVKLDSTLSDIDDDDDFKPNRRNDEEEPLTRKPEKTPGRLYRAVENIILVWLDASLDNPDNDTIKSKIQLRQIARTLRTYTDPKKCLQLFKEIKNEKIFLIVSGNLSETFLEQIDDYPQLAVVYIFCQYKSKYEYLIEQYPKIKGIYTDILNIGEQLKIDSKQWDNDLNTFQISSKISSESKLNSQQLLFLQNQLYKQYLLEIQYNQNSKEDLIEYCQKLYIENDEEIEIIKEFGDNYEATNAIEWYIKDCFIYHMLNRAIRMKDMKILFQMGFFLKDIQQQLEEEYSNTVHRSTLTVYRGQGMKMEYFNELKENPGGLLSFNGLVSTSKKQSIAYEFAQRSLTNGFPIAVIFRIKIDPKTTSTPFISTNSDEFEVLLSLKSIFSIEKIDEIENNLWQIDLILIDQIFSLIENEKYNHLNNYEKLGELLIDMNELNPAKDVYEINLPNNSSPNYMYIYKQLGFIHTKLEIYNQAVLYYNLSLQTKSTESLNDYVMLANIHNEIGKLFYQQKKFPEAVEKFQYALDIQLKYLSPNDLVLNNTYNLLAMIYEKNNEFETALEYYQKQLDIQEQSTSTKQSDLALTHFKMGICLENLERLDEAIHHIQKSIDMTSSDDVELDERQTILERIREEIE